MILVRKVDFKVNCNTRLWCSDKIFEMVGTRPDVRFWARVKRLAQNGFAYGERPTPPMVKHEWKQVYRVGFVDSLFRIIGFYQDQSKHDFIAIDSFLKKGQQLTAGQRKLIDQVAIIKSDALWRKVEEDEEPQSTKTT